RHAQDPSCTRLLRFSRILRECPKSTAPSPLVAVFSELAARRETMHSTRPPVQFVCLARRTRSDVGRECSVSRCCVRSTTRCWKPPNYRTHEFGDSVG